MRPENQFLVYNSQTDKNMMMFDASTNGLKPIFYEIQGRRKSGHLAFLTALNLNLFKRYIQLDREGCRRNIQFTRADLS